MPVVNFEFDHIHRLDLRMKERERFNADPKIMAKMEALALHGDGRTIMYKDKILGVFGCFELWPGVFEMWAFPSSHVEDHPVVYLRTIKRHIRIMENLYHPRRLQTASLADKQHDDWMTFLGFKCETPDGMKNHSVLGETFHMWSKIYGDSE